MRAKAKSTQHYRRLRELAALAASDRRRQLRRTNEAVEALERVSSGSYGVCRECSRRIPAARLRAKPEATRCLECQLEHERNRAA